MYLAMPLHIFLIHVNVCTSNLNYFHTFATHKRLSYNEQYKTTLAYCKLVMLPTKEYNFWKDYNKSCLIFFSYKH